MRHVGKDVVMTVCPSRLVLSRRQHYRHIATSEI